MTTQDIIQGIQDLDTANQAFKNVIVPDLRTQLANSVPKVFDRLERLPWLVASGAAANTGSVGNLADDIQTIQNGLNYATRTIKPKGAWADKYWFYRFPVDPNSKRFRQEGSFIFPTIADAKACNCVEFDFQKVDDLKGPTFNLGLQFNLSTFRFRIWNRSQKAWIDTGNSIAGFTGSAWTDVVADYHIDDSNVYYDSVIVNGKQLSIPQEIAKMPAPLLGLGVQLNYGYQLDGNKVGTTYTTAIDRFKLTCWNG
jgi:hypothetical protein